MNPDEIHKIESLIEAWPVETTDLTSRVSAAIGVPATPLDVSAELLAEIRSLRNEMETFRRMNASLHEEVVRLRHELAPRKTTRLSPYSPAEGLVRLS